MCDIKKQEWFQSWDVVDKFIDEIKDLKEGRFKSSDNLFPCWTKEERCTLDLNLRMIFIYMRVRLTQWINELNLESEFYDKIDPELMNKLTSHKLEDLEFANTVNRFKIRVPIECYIIDPKNNETDNEPGRDSE